MNDISFLWYTSKDSRTTSLANLWDKFRAQTGYQQTRLGDVEDLEDAGLWSLPVAPCWVESLNSLKTTTCLVGFLNWIHPQFSRLPAYGHLSKPSRRRMVYHWPKLIQKETKSHFYKHRRASNNQDFFWSGHRSVQLFNQDFPVHGDASPKSIPARCLLVVRGLIVWPKKRAVDVLKRSSWTCLNVRGPQKDRESGLIVGNEQIRVPSPFFFKMPSWLTVLVSESLILVPSSLKKR